MKTSLLVFELNNRRYAIHMARAREIVRAVAITPLPGAPRVVAGLIDVRGTIVPVLDLRVRFGFPAQPLALSDQFIIAWTGDRAVALHVGNVVGTMAMNSTDIDPSEKVTSNVEHIAGVARTADGLILIHDLATFFAAAEEATLQSSLAQYAEQKSG